MRIAFLSRIQRQFNGNTLYQEPLGGTQSAMIYLARALAGLGHEVHVFCHGEPAQVDGVTYQSVAQLARFARQHPLDVFVSVADELALGLKIPAKHTLWWSHNDYSYVWDEKPDLRAQISQTLALKADKLITVSQWQADILSQTFALPQSHFYVSRNGVYWPYFEETTPRESEKPLRLIYTSVPERGLQLLLEMFPRLRAEISDLELWVFSGHVVWGKSQEDAETQALLQRAEAMPGVFLKEPVPHQALAKALQQCDVMVYPSQAAEPVAETGFWAETSCIAALEAQAAGLPVIASQRGALVETIQDQHTGYLIPGEPDSVEYQDAFVSKTLALLQDHHLRKKMGEQARQRIQAQYTWEIVAREWSHYLTTEMRSTRMTTAPLKSAFPPPEISVIIPTFNRARNLKNCLESLTWQSYKAFEVIVCDDGSTDPTQQVAESYKDRLNLRYRFQEDLGFRAAEARNMGIKIARGKLLVFLDSDLVIPPTFLQAHLDAHAAHPNVAVNSFVYRMIETQDEDLGLPPDEYISRHRAWLKPDSRTRYQLFQRTEPVEETYFLDSNALSMRKTDVLKLGGFDGDFVGWGHEDTELGYRLPSLGLKLFMLKEGAVSYHQYHYVSDAKDDEMKENWTRLTTKHKIEKWYHPLWELDVLGPVSLSDPEHTETADAQWTLKTGHSLPFLPPYYTLECGADGLLKRIWQRG